jgi:hypothetical protein
MLLFLIGFMTGILPTNVIDQAWLTEIGRWASPFVVYHMGTMVKMEALRKECRTVIMALFGMLVAVGAIFLLIPFIGQSAAYVGSNRDNDQNSGYLCYFKLLNQSEGILRYRSYLQNMSPGDLCYPACKGS